MSSLTKGTVTIEKQHVTLSVAVSACFALLLIAFSVGKSMGSNNTSSEAEFKNINSKLEEISKSMAVAEGKREAYSTRVDTSIADLNRQIAVLGQRVDDLGFQVTGHQSSFRKMIQ